MNAPPATDRRRGRPPAASAEDVVAAAAVRFAAGERVDVTAISEQLGSSRMTVKRWFGSREGLIGEVLARESERILLAARRRAPGSGPQALLDAFDAANRAIAAAEPLRSYLRREGPAAFRVLTASDGVVQPRTVACVEQIIRAEMQRSGWTPVLDPASLAYAIVRLAEAFIYSDALADIRGDVDRLRETEAVLLGA
jgi:AcrR family transcriptional regulator